MLLSLVSGWRSPFGSISDVAAVGRVPELRRWSCGLVPARRHAFESAGFRVDTCSGEVLRDWFRRPSSLNPGLAEIIAFERWGDRFDVSQRCHLSLASRVIHGKR